MAQTPTLLNLSVDDLVDPQAGAIDDDAFPEFWSIGDLDLPLTYEFDPSSATDGLTVHVPVAGLDRLDPSRFEWQVPGLRADLVTALVRSLPKQVRRDLVPIPDTVAAIASELRPENGGLIDVLRRQLARISGGGHPPDRFRSRSGAIASQAAFQCDRPGRSICWQVARISRRCDFSSGIRPAWP